MEELWSHRAGARSLGESRGPIRATSLCGDMSAALVLEPLVELRQIFLRTIVTPRYDSNNQAVHRESICVFSSWAA